MVKCADMVYILWCLLCNRKKHTLLPEYDSSRWALCCVSAVCIVGVQTASPARLLHCSGSVLSSRLSERPLTLSLFILVELSAVVTPIPSPRSPSTISSFRLQSSLSSSIWKRSQLNWSQATYWFHHSWETHLNTACRQVASPQIFLRTSLSTEVWMGFYDFCLNV